MTPAYAIIIPHYNDHARLDRCLAALTRSDLSDSEVVVVDNGSSPPPGQIVARYPGVRAVAEAAKGAALARNRGVAATQAPTLLFLDADCVPDADWVAAARRNAGRADLIGGAIRVFDESPAPRTGAQAFETVFAFDNRAYVERKGFSVTANLITTRAVFDAVGPFVNGLSEDAEWCLRARAKGYRIAYADDLRVSHPTRGDWAALARKWRRITDEMFALHLAQGGGRAGWGLRAAAVAVSGPAHLPRVLRARALNGTGERLRAAATLIRLRLVRAAWMVAQAVAG
jgi:GT2 family glycosyltransferase